MGYGQYINSEINIIMKVFRFTDPDNYTMKCDKGIIKETKSKDIRTKLHYADKEFIILNIMENKGREQDMYRVFYRYDEKVKTYKMYKTVWYYDRGMRNKYKTVYYESEITIWYNYDNNHDITVITNLTKNKHIVRKNHYGFKYKLKIDHFTQKVLISRNGTSFTNMDDLLESYDGMKSAISDFNTQLSNLKFY